MDQIPTHILLQMQREQEQDAANSSGMNEIETNSLLNGDVFASKEILSNGMMKSDEDESDDGDDNGDEGDEEGGAGKTEEEIEEADFVSWFGSLKDEEAVRPKEEAVQVRTPLLTLLCCAVLHCTVL